MGRLANTARWRCRKSGLSGLIFSCKSVKLCAMSIIPLNRPREIVAIHEAGHAVIAFLTGYHVIYDAVDIDGINSEGDAATIPLERNAALCAQRVQENWVLSEFELRKQQCVISVAGYTAERVHAERTGVPFDETGAGRGAHGDMLAVKNLWGPGNFVRFSNEVLPELRTPMVWTMVETFAQALSTSEGPFPAEAAMTLLEKSRRQTGAQFKLFLPDLRE